MEDDGIACKCIVCGKTLARWIDGALFEEDYNIVGKDGVGFEVCIDHDRSEIRRALII